MPLQSEHFYRLKVLLWQYKYIGIVFILIILYFSFNTIYINFFLHVGKPAYIGDIQGSNQPFFYSLDKFQEIRYEGQ